MEEFFAFEQGTILNDFLCTAAHTSKRSHDDCHEQIADKVLVAHHRIPFGRCIASQQSADYSQQGSLKEGDSKVLHIGNLRLEITVQEYGELFQHVGLLWSEGGTSLTEGSGSSGRFFR